MEEKKKEMEKAMLKKERRRRHNYQRKISLKETMMTSPWKQRIQKWSSTRS